MNHRQPLKPILLRLPETLRLQLELLARREAMTMTGLMQRALRELLRREGLWPPAGEPALQPWEK